MSSCVHSRARPYIGRLLDTAVGLTSNLLKSLALPRGLRTPVFAVRGRSCPPADKVWSPVGTAMRFVALAATAVGTVVLAMLTLCVPKTPSY